MILVLLTPPLPEIFSKPSPTQLPSLRFLRVYPSPFLKPPNLPFRCTNKVKPPPLSSFFPQLIESFPPKLFPPGIFPGSKFFRSYGYAFSTTSQRSFVSPFLPIVGRTPPPSWACGFSLHPTFRLSIFFDLFLSRV